MKRRFFHVAWLLPVLMLALAVGCKDKNPPSDGGGGTEQGGGGENPGGGGEDPGGGGTPGGGGQTQAAADIFKAFDKVGNEFWYRWTSSSSYVSYGSGTQHSSSAKCVSWEVISASSSSATVYEYTNIDFDHPSTLTFTRSSDGTLNLNGHAVTNTQTPEFYCMSFGKSGEYEWKEMYNNGEYTNIFYTKSNGYTSTSTSHDISETWGACGLQGSQYSSMSDNASSYSKTQTLVKATTAYKTYGNVGEPPAVTDVTEVKDYSGVSDYVKSHPGSVDLWVTFTQNGTANNTWGYCLGMYLDDGNGNAVCYPFYQISDLSTYVKAAVVESGEFVTKDHFVWPEKDFSDNSHTIYIYLTPEGVALGQQSGVLYFGIFALGYGYISEVNTAFSLSFQNGAPARLKSNVREINGRSIPTKRAQRLRASDREMHAIR